MTFQGVAWSLLRSRCKVGAVVKNWCSFGAEVRISAVLVPLATMSELFFSQDHKIIMKWQLRNDSNIALKLSQNSVI